jgi:hypothetical protein
MASDRVMAFRLPGRNGIVKCITDTETMPTDIPSNVPAIEARLVELKEEHRDLDLAIAALLATPAHDQLQLRRMKKRKLLLKDQISFLEAQLTPDIRA